jgi:lysophospholipase L1-like esterase
VLGDSLSEGVGDPLPGGGWRGWAALLGESLGADVRVLNVALSGARSADVAGPQLQAALRHRPHLASVVAGGNDTLRGAFDVAEVAADLHAALGALRAAGAEVLTACLPDAGSVLGLPRPLARPLARRMRAVNHVVHALSAHHGAIHVHAVAHAWGERPEMLGADRLHPNEAGHRLLAGEFHRALAAAGLATGAGPRPEPDGRPPGRAAAAWWLATRGTRWVAERCTDLLPDLLRLALAEHRGDPARLDEAANRATRDALRALGVAVDAGGGPPADQPPRGARSTTKRSGVPGGAWAAADREEAGTTPITG